MVLWPAICTISIPILPIGFLDFCQQKLTAPPLWSMSHLVGYKWWLSHPWVTATGRTPTYKSKRPPPLQEEPNNLLGQSFDNQLTYFNFTSYNPCIFIKQILWYVSVVFFVKKSLHDIINRITAQFCHLYRMTSRWLFECLLNLLVTGPPVPYQYPLNII